MSDSEEERSAYSEEEDDVDIGTEDSEDDPGSDEDYYIDEESGKHVRESDLWNGKERKAFEELHRLLYGGDGGFSSSRFARGDTGSKSKRPAPGSGSDAASSTSEVEEEEEKPTKKKQRHSPSRSSKKAKKASASRSKESSSSDDSE